VTPGWPLLAQVQLVTLAVIVGLMLAETYRSRVNEAALAARGAVRPDGDVWVWMAALYPVSFLVMGAEGAWRAGVLPGLAVRQVPGAWNWYVAGLLLFVAAKAVKYWAIATLGDRWSFRVMIIPGRPLVRTGPYRFVAHPNYVGVAGELVGTAMMMTAAIAGPLRCVAFGAVLSGRIRFEERMLESFAPGPEAGV
jgi:methyltransferase